MSAEVDTLVSTRLRLPRPASPGPEPQSEVWGGGVGSARGGCGPGRAGVVAPGLPGPASCALPEGALAPRFPVTLTTDPLTRVSCFEGSGPPARRVCAQSGKQQAALRPTYSKCLETSVDVRF